MDKLPFWLSRVSYSNKLKRDKTPRIKNKQSNLLKEKISLRILQHFEVIYQEINFH